MCRTSIGRPTSNGTYVARTISATKRISVQFKDATTYKDYRGINMVILDMWPSYLNSPLRSFQYSRTGLYWHLQRIGMVGNFVGVLIVMVSKRKPLKINNYFHDCGSKGIALCKRWYNQYRLSSLSLLQRHFPEQVILASNYHAVVYSDVMWCTTLCQSAFNCLIRWPFFFCIFPVLWYA